MNNANAADTLTLRDGTVVPMPRERNGLVDGDAVRRLLNYTGPTAAQHRDDCKTGCKVHPFYAAR
jgi:hypothetical protein